MNAIPTRLSAAVFATKAALLRAQRSAMNIANPIHRHRLDPGSPLPFVAAQSITPLWPDTSAAEMWHQRGKVENLRLAAKQLQGCRIPTGEVFSFWRQVGKATAARGFQTGRMLQEGCMIPSIGGGLCQLSNALYQVALDSGCEIVERHRHSRVVPGSATAFGRDATVAWNYIDLRFRPHTDMQLTAELTSTHLIVGLRSTIATPQTLPAIEPVAAPINDDNACDTCGEIRCFRKHDPAETRHR